MRTSPRQTRKSFSSACSNSASGRIREQARSSLRSSTRCSAARTPTRARSFRASARRRELRRRALEPSPARSGDLLTSGSIGDLAVRSLTRGMGRVSELLNDQTEGSVAGCALIAGTDHRRSRTGRRPACSRAAQQAISHARGRSHLRSLDALSRARCDRQGLRRGALDGSRPLVASDATTGPATASAKPGEHCSQAGAPSAGCSAARSGRGRRSRSALRAGIDRLCASWYFPVRVAARPFDRSRQP